MAHKIVNDSNWASIWVKEVNLGTDANALPAVNSLHIGSGAKIGLIGDTPRLGEDGSYYSTVDTAALVRFEGVSGAFTDGAAVYATPTGTITGTATGNTRIGYANRAKTATGAGDLYVQLTPQSA